MEKTTKFLIISLVIFLIAAAFMGVGIMYRFKDVNDDGVIYSLNDKSYVVSDTSNEQKNIICRNKIRNYPVKIIGEKAFCATAIESVVLEEGIEIIGPSAFENCKHLKSITLPDSLKEIHNQAFLDCDNLEEVHVSSIEVWNNIVIGYSPLANKNAKLIINDKPVETLLYDKNIPGFNRRYKHASINLVIPEGVTEIQDTEFKGFNNLLSIKLPSTLATIGKCAFEGCESLTSIDIPDNVTIIKDAAFRGCKNVRHLKLSQNLDEIGKFAFDNMEIDGDLIIPDSVTTIGDRAFDNLQANSITIGSNVQVIGKECFRYAKANSLEIKEGVTDIEEFAFASTFIDIVNVPSSCTFIGKKAFKYSYMKEINLKEGLEIIDNNAFEDCHYLKKVIIPKGVKEIRDETFKGCSELEYLWIPKTMTPGNYITDWQSNPKLTIMGERKPYGYSDWAPTWRGGVDVIWDVPQP